jgi:RNA polymerase sigma-70 factor (ECF subfamily)
VLRSPTEAEDAAQEAFVKAFRSLRSFRGESRFYTWLYHIAVRVCLDRRRLARWGREEQIADSARRRDSETADSELRIVVEALLERLSPPMRAALVLRELEGLEYEEIALALKIPVGTVRSRLNAARRKFRELWESAEREARSV